MFKQKNQCQEKKVPECHSSLHPYETKVLEQHPGAFYHKNTPELTEFFNLYWLRAMAYMWYQVAVCCSGIPPPLNLSQQPHSMGN
jgi:hypothetical protein